MHAQINTVKSYAKYYLAVIVVLVFVLMIVSSVIRIHDFQEYQIEIAHRAAKMTSNGIGQLLNERIRQVKLLVRDQRDYIDLYSNNSNSEFIREKLTAKIARYFPDYIGFVIVSQNKKPVVQGLERQHGLNCIRKSQELLFNSNLHISLHPIVNNVHYDIMTQWGDKKSGGYFSLSFKINDIVSLLQLSQPHLHHLQIVSLKSNAKIAITSSGAQSVLSQSDPAVLSQQKERILANYPINKTPWELHDLRSMTLFSEYYFKVFLQLFFVIALFSILLFITLRMIFSEEKKRRVIEQQLRQSKENLLAMNIELKRIAVTDVVTGISSRRSFDERIKQEISRGRRNDQPLAVIMADIDHFKLYNDTFGHTKGDESLYQVAQGIRSVLKRPTDFVARYGGEEFVILLVNTPLAGARQIAEDIRAAVFNLKIPQRSETEEYVTLSLGLSLACDPYTEVTTKLLVEQADKALYQAKDLGRNKVCVYQELKVVNVQSG